MRTTIFLFALFFTVGGSPSPAAAEEPKSAPQRVLAAPSFPDSFKDRTWDEGTLPTDAGPAKYRDMIAERDGMTLILRQFMVPPATWDMKTPKQMLDGARDNMVGDGKTVKIDSEKDFAVDGFPGRSFVLSREGETSVTRMDYFLLKPDVFIHVYIGPKNGLENADVKKFFQGIQTMEAKPKSE